AGFILLLAAWVSYTAWNNLGSTAWAFPYSLAASVSVIWAVLLAFRTRRLAWPQRKLEVEGARA
ncbi:MAG: hypothetical protein QOF28_2445, partial [Actinomycetota bacterium]|nr:hypothetical protein [Actinomycetota bacterium]